MVSNFDAQFTEQQIDFLKEEENKKNKKQTNKKTIKIHKRQNHNHKNWPKTATTTQENKTRKTSFQHKEKTHEKKTKKNREDSDSKSLLPENKDKRGGKINFQKQNSGWKPRLLICEVARSLGKERVGRWRKEGKGRKGKRKKEKSQEQIMGKIGGASQRETNQVSLFLLPTNKRSIHMWQQI